MTLGAAQTPRAACTRDETSRSVHNRFISDDNIERFPRIGFEICREVGCRVGFGNCFCEILWIVEVGLFGWVSLLEIGKGLKLIIRIVKLFFG